MITLAHYDAAEYIVKDLRELDRVRAIAANKTGGAMYVQIQGRAYDDVTNDVRVFVLASLDRKRAVLVESLRELGIVEVEHRHGGPA